MKTIRYILGALASVALVCFVGCEKDPNETHPDGLELSLSYVSIPVAGGSVEVTVDADDAWAFVSDSTVSSNKTVALNSIPDWLTVTPQSGSAGKTVVTFSAGAAAYGRNQELKIGSGAVFQYIQVQQGVNTPSPSTCADVIAGADGKQFQVTGTVGAIANTTYGNWYLSDDTGEIYIYGTLDANGGEKNFSSLGIETGDVVTVTGPKSTYGTTIELVNVTVLSIKKSLIKMVNDSVEAPYEGGTVSATVAYKGSGAYFTIPEDMAAWVQFKSVDYIPGVPSKLESSPADTCVFTFNVLANDGAEGREGVVTFTSANGSGSSEGTFKIIQVGGIQDVSIAEFNDAAVSSSNVYRITGIVTKVDNDKYGNFHIKDWSGETYVYGLDDFASSGIDQYDIVTLTGKRGVYRTTIEMLDASLEKVIDVTEVSVSDFLTKEDSDDVYWRVTGTVTSIANATYGNLYISDGTSEVYVYGCYPGWGATGDDRKNFLATAGIEVGDTLTMIGYKTTYTNKKTGVATIELAGGNYVSHTKANAAE